MLQCCFLVDRIAWCNNVRLAKESYDEWSNKYAIFQAYQRIREIEGTESWWISGRKDDLVLDPDHCEPRVHFCGTGVEEQEIQKRVRFEGSVDDPVSKDMEDLQ